MTIESEVIALTTATTALTAAVNVSKATLDAGVSTAVAQAAAALSSQLAAADSALTAATIVGAGNGQFATVAVDINAGTIDGVAIGQAVPAAANVTTLGVTSTLTATKSVACGTGLLCASYFNMNALDGAGSQWGAAFFTTNSVTGNSNPLEVDCILTANYHSAGFAMPLTKGIEAGGNFLSGAGTSVTLAYGIEAVYPTLSAGATVGTAAAFHVPTMATGGMTNVYAFFNESLGQIYSAGPIVINDTSGVAATLKRTGGGVTQYINSYANLTTAGATIAQQFARGTEAAPLNVVAGDIVANWSAREWVNGAMRETCKINVFAGAVSSTDYSATMRIQKVKTNTTALVTVLSIDPDGNVTIGAANSTGSKLYVLGEDDKVQVTVRGNATQTTDLQQWQNSSGTVLASVNGDGVLRGASAVPATAGAAGNAGQITWGAGYIYVCVAANTWQRAALATW